MLATLQQREFARDWSRARGHSEGLAWWAAPGLQAAAVYRLGSWALRQPLVLRLVLDPAYVVLNVLMKILWGIEISRHARIGPGLYIGHFGGITISRYAVIGANCGISQQVTIGVAGERGSGGAPVIGDDVYIAPGARLFGPIRIGNNVKVGANAVVYRDVPDNAVVALDPGFKILSYRGNRRP
ncbi:MAG: serine acetyltransferase [Clostridia bacterium]